MDIEGLSRWQMIREIVVQEKSGILIAQLGKHFLHWMIERGKLVCISSTLPEYSFTQFLLGKEIPARADLLRAQNLTHSQRSIGSALIASKLLSDGQLKELLGQHWSSLTYHLLQGSTHLFWSDRQEKYKHHFVRADVPLQELLLSADRTCIDTRAALRFAQKIPVHYRITNWPLVERSLSGVEQNLLHYLKNSAPVSAMLKDAELDRMTCYRTLFLLWISGVLQEPMVRKPVLTSSKPKRNVLLNRLRSLPPDWIFPLLAGVLIGVLLAPGPVKSTTPVTSQHIDSLRDAMNQPAWRPDDTHENHKTEDEPATDSH